jgi:L-ascorbate metabolism protein UlaG (beta-lactamase superfamily)
MERQMNHINRPKVDMSRSIFALRHIETGEYICLRHEGNEYLACFTDADTAFQFREELGLLEHVDIASMPLGEAPFDHFWLDGDMIAQPTVADQAVRFS